MKDNYFLFFEDNQKYSFDDYTVDFSSYSIRYKKKDVNVTPSQFKVLCVFLNNANKVISRNKIMDLAELSYESSFRSVDIIIHKIKKLPEISRFIISIYGIGYIFKKNVKKEISKNYLSTF